MLLCKDESALADSSVVGLPLLDVVQQHHRALWDAGFINFDKQHATYAAWHGVQAVGHF